MKHHARVVCCLLTGALAVFGSHDQACAATVAEMVANVAEAETTRSVEGLVALGTRYSGTFGRISRSTRRNR